MLRETIASAIIALAAAPAFAQTKTFDAIAGEELREDTTIGKTRRAVKGDPSLAIEPFRHSDLPVIRWFNEKPADIGAVKQRREALAKDGFPVVEIVDVGTLGGAAAALVRRYPGAAHDPLSEKGDARAILQNVDPATTLRDLDAIESRLERTRSPNHHIEMRDLLITKDGHVLLDGGDSWTSDGDAGLPQPQPLDVTDSDPERLKFEAVRRVVRFEEGLVRGGVVRDLAEAHAFAREIFDSATTIANGKDVADPRTRTVQRLLSQMYEGRAGQELAKRLPRPCYSDQLTRALSLHQDPLAKPAPKSSTCPPASGPATSGAAGALTGAMGGKKSAPR